MAEAIGVAASAVTLAALFNQCIQCFAYFKAAQNCPIEVETLLVKLDCEKAKLLVWANNIGILQSSNEGRHELLADLHKEPLIRRCIEQIISLRTDAQELQARYGSRTMTGQEPQRSIAIISANSMSIFRTARLRFFARTYGNGSSPNLLARITWTIEDGSKFNNLIKTLRELVNNLIILVPVSCEIIDNTVEEDIMLRMSPFPQDISSVT